MLRDLFSDLRYRLRALFKRDEVERELDEELRDHVERQTSANVAAGMSASEARTAALRAVGGIERRKEEVRATRGVEVIEHLAQDVAYALRGLRRAPGFTIAVVLTLALGVGANTVVYTILNRFFLRTPGGVRDANEIHRIVLHYVDQRRAQQTVTNFNYPEFRGFADAMPPGFRSAAYFTNHSDRLGVDRYGSSGVVTYVIGDFFGLLGVEPVAGRRFRDEETSTRALSAVAIISYRLWQSRFGSTPDVVGRTIEVGAHLYTVIGVAPEPFSGVDLDAVDVWVPRNSLGSWDDWSPDRVETPRMTNLHVLVRGPSTRGARAKGESEATSWLRSSGMVPDSTATATFASLRTAVDVGFQGTEALMSVRLAEISLLILIIACANVANLLLVRTMQRNREIATRLALGASRNRVVAQILTESLLLAALGGAAALACAVWLSPVLSHAILPTVHWQSTGVSPGTFLLAMLLVVLTGALTGIVPAMHASRSDVQQSLRGDPGSGVSRRTGVRSAMLAMQVTLAFVLLAAATLLVRSALNVEAINTGYETGRLAYAEVLPGMTYSKHDAEASRSIGLRLPAVAVQLARVPGVESVALSLRAPLHGFAVYPVFLPGRDSMPTLNRNPPLTQVVSPEFFGVTGLHVVDGRTLQADDRAGSAPVVVVNQTMARTMWPRQRALGNCIIVSTRDAPCRTVVGVVSDAHYYGIFDAPAMQFYMPFGQADTSLYPGVILIRSQMGRLVSTTVAVRDAFTAMTQSWGTPTVRTMDDALAPILHPWRLAAEVFAGTALLALIVAGVGIYGTVAYTVSQQRHEMGVRLALGARRSGILRLVVGGGLRVVGIGLVVGAILVLVLGRLVTSMLYGTTAHDPVMFLVVATSMLAVAVAACAIPAWRAAHLDPVALLRSE